MAHRSRGALEPDRPSILLEDALRRSYRRVRVGGERKSLVSGRGDLLWSRRLPELRHLRDDLIIGEAELEICAFHGDEDSFW